MRAMLQRHEQIGDDSRETTFDIKSSSPYHEKQHNSRETMKAEFILQALFELDPMGTCCKENDLHDEYAPEARMLAGMELTEENIKTVFDEYFWEDCLKDEVIYEIKLKCQEIERLQGH